ncbi:unnamed protein product [Effrenium voratum]|nr:unnamed protein product [Effrenium voratum]
MLVEAVEHLEFSMKIYEWQVRRKKRAIFEHPATSMAWKEECVLRVLKLPEVQRVRADQCQYGLQVGGGPNRKPTDFMVTGEELAKLRSHKDLPPYSMERQIKKKFQPPRFKPQQMRRGGSPPEEEEEAEGREPLEVLTAEEKKMIKSLHSKLGYPSIPDFARMLRLARA